MDEIVSLPFYQDGDIYKTATHLLRDEFTPTVTQHYISAAEDDENDAWVQPIIDAIDELSQVEVVKDDLDRLLLYQQAEGSILQFKKAIDKFKARLTWLAFDQSVHAQGLITHDDGTLSIGNSRLYVEDAKDTPNPSEMYNAYSSDVVLNRNNPFADVSIKDQQFIYAADHGRFNSLELNTSHTLTRVNKNDDQSAITLQPGFKIRNSTKLDRQQHSDISFDDTLTTEIAQSDDRNYIYVDIADIV